MQYPVFQFNRPTKVFGITILQIYALVGAVIFFMLVAVVASKFVKISLLYFPVCAAIIGFVFLELKKINRKKYPNYLVSSFSYKFFQPKVIEPSRIELKPLSYYKEQYFKLKQLKNEQQKSIR